MRSGERGDAIGIVGVLGRRHLHQFSVEVHHMGTSSTLVEVVHILGDDGHVPLFF